MDSRQLQTWKVYLPITGRPVKNDHWRWPRAFQPLPEVAEAVGKDWGPRPSRKLRRCPPCALSAWTCRALCVSLSPLPHRSQTARASPGFSARRSWVFTQDSASLIGQMDAPCGDPGTGIRDTRTPGRGSSVSSQCPPLPGLQGG